jgi:prepilin-type N-terminal cleavage/methylation domain-containing protein
VKRAESGFTVVELLVVAAVLSMFAVLAAPALSVSAESRLDTVQLEIQDALDHARSLSWRRRSPHGVRFDVEGQWVAVVDAAGRPIEDPLVRGPYVVHLDGPGQPQGVRLVGASFGGRPLAAFNGRGVLHERGGLLLRVGSTSRRLRLDSAGPTLQVAEGAP